MLSTVGRSTEIDKGASLQQKLSRFIRPANYGKLVEALYSNGMWYNALVTGFESTGELHVQFVDDGIDAVVSSEHVRQLGTYGGFAGFDVGATPEEMPPAVIEPAPVISGLATNARTKPQSGQIRRARAHVNARKCQVNSSDFGQGNILIFLLDKLTCGLDILMTQLFGHGLARLALVSQTVCSSCLTSYRLS